MLSTRARRRRAGRCRWRCSRWPSSTGAARGVEIALFGEVRGLHVPFPYRHLGVLEPDALAHAYASATVGVVALD